MDLFSVTRTRHSAVGHGISPYVLHSCYAMILQFCFLSIGLDEIENFKKINFMFSPCIFKVNHFYWPTNALNYIKSCSQLVAPGTHTTGPNFTLPKTDYAHKTSQIISVKHV